MVALSSEQPALTNVNFDISTLGSSAIVPSELLHNGATTKAMPLAKRSRNVEGDDCAEAEKMTKKSAAEEHIEDKTSFMVAERVRSTGLGAEEAGEIDKKEENNDKVGEINQVLKTKSSLKLKVKTKERSRQVRDIELFEVEAWVLKVVASLRPTFRKKCRKQSRIT